MNKRLETLHDKVVQELNSIGTWDRSAGYDRLKFLFEEFTACLIESEHADQEEDINLNHDGPFHAAYRDLFYNSTVAYVVIDGLQRILNINQTACALLGVERAPVVHTLFTQLIHPENLEAYLLFFTSLTRGKETNACETALISRRNQEVLDVRIDGVLQPTPHGKELEYRLVITDLTRIKEVEKQLAKEKAQARDQELLLNEMGRIAGVGAWELDCSTMKQKWTEETYTIHDRQKGVYHPNSKEELSRFEPGSREIISKAFEDALTKGIPYDLFVEMTTILGNRKWVRAVCSPLLTDGKVTKLTGTLQDVSESKRSGDQLAKLAERLNLATKSAGIGIWDWDIVKNELVWDEQMVALYGLQPGSFKGAYEAWLKGLHPDDREKSHNNSESAVKGEKEYDTEFRVLWPDGSVHWLKANGRVFRDVNGAAVRMIGVNYDITGRKLAEQDLKRWADTFENVAFGFVIGRPENNQLEMMNPAFAKMYGFSTTELTGMPIADVFAPEFRDELAAHIQQVYEKGHHTWESRHIRKDGTTFPVFVDAVAVKDPAGKVLYRIVSVQDITERKQVEEKLRESEMRYNLLFRKSNIPVVIMRLPEVIIADVNEAAEILTGFSREELIGKTSAELGIISHAKRTESISSFKDKGAITDKAMRILTKTGKERYISITTNPVEINGQPYAYTSILDITDVHLSEIRERNRSRILQMLSEKFGLDEILREIQVSIEEEAPDSICTILLVDKTGKYLQARIPNQLPDFYNTAIDGLEIAEGMGSCGTAAFTGETVFVENVLTHPYWKSFKELARKAGIASCWSKPVVSFSGQVLGTFAIYGSKAKLPNETDIARIDYAANLTRLAIEKKAGEEELRASESKFRAVFDNAPVGISLLDDQHNLLESNSMLGRIVHMDKKALAGGKYRALKYIREDGMEIPVGELASTRAIAEQRPVRNVINGIVLENGETIWTQVSAAPLGVNDPRYVVITQDISELKQAVDALKENERRLRKTIETTSDGFWIVDPARRFIEVNEAYCNMSGYSRQELISMNISDIEALESNVDTDERIRKISNQGNDRFETIHRRKDGSLFDVEVSVNLLDQEQGLMICFCRDISERKAAERQLLDRETELNNAQELAHMASWQIDLTTYQLSVSKNYKKMIGIENEEEEITYDFFISHVHPDDVVQMNPDQYNFTPDSPPVTSDFRMVMSDGTIRWFQNKMVGEFSQGRLVALKGTNIDITEKKESEREILELNTNLERKVAERTHELIEANNELAKTKEIAEKANRSKSDFLANMSHEIRTPMNAILGYSELLGSIVNEGSAKDYLDSIKSSGRTLLTLINDILDLSKIEAGKLELKFDFIETASFFKEFENIFAFKTREKGLRFFTEIAGDTPPFLYVDETRLRQVIINLVGNAVKFTEEGYVKLKIHSNERKQIVYSEKRTEETASLIIDVEDTGIGIPRESLEDIFGSFVQVHHDNTLGGTGLGLAISQRLVGMMNGRITVKSATGEGSTFTITLSEVPYLTSYNSIDHGNVMHPESIEFEKAMILVVDDIEVNRRVIKDILNDTAIEVLEAASGSSALEIMKTMLPDLVISDLRMPGMNGFELLGIIKSDKKMKSVPVIAYSASVMKEQKERIFSSEFAGLLIKPLCINDLYMELANILPYRIKEGMGEKEKTDEKITDMEGLIRSLEGSYLETVKTFEKTQPIGQVKQFGNSLVSLGEKHTSGKISTYGRNLISAAESFDIDKMLALLDNYGNILEELKKM